MRTNEFVGSSSDCVDLVVDLPLAKFNVDDLIAKLASTSLHELVEVLTVVVEVRCQRAGTADG